MEQIKLKCKDRKKNWNERGVSGREDEQYRKLRCMVYAKYRIIKKNLLNK